MPTLAEMARIKAWLLATRRTVRDYLDTVVLLERLGPDRLDDAFRSFDRIYAQESDVSPLSEVVERLAAAEPGDKPMVSLKEYRGIRPPWNDWEYLAEKGREQAQHLVRVVLEEP